MRALVRRCGLLLTLLAGCASPSREHSSARLPVVTVALGKLSMSDGTEISANALKRFDERVRVQIEKEFGYRCLDPALASSVTLGGPLSSEGMASLRERGADYLLIPVIVQARDRSIGGTLVVDGTLYRCRDGSAVWQASGKASGIAWDRSAMGTAGLGQPGLLDIAFSALEDPNAFARNAGIALLQSFPAHLALLKAQEQGAALVYLDRKGQTITPLSGRRLQLLEDVHVMANAQGTKFVVPAQTLAPYVANDRGTYYVAHLMYVFGVSGSSVDDRVEELGGLFVSSDGKTVQVWCHRTSVRRKAPEGIRFRFVE